MKLKVLGDTPSWEWPETAGKTILEVLVDGRADEADRLLAAELAGDIVVINDELAEGLLSVVRDGNAPEELRGKAAIALGPVLEQADTDGFEDPDDVLITESTFRGIRESLRRLYTDADVPKEVRRRILEAAVRAPQPWQRDAIRAAYRSDDEEWRLTAVFGMRWIDGFEPEILEALRSDDFEMHYEAVCAAGEWGVDAAWSHVLGLLTSEDTEKPLLLAAIEAAAGIRPREARDVLAGLTDSEDEDIVEAADEAMAIAGMLSGDEFDGDAFDDDGRDDDELDSDAFDDDAFDDDDDKRGN